MLRKETVNAATLELLKRLMGDGNLKEFFLVGGTALSLQIGHRVSIDIDLFSRLPFDEAMLLNHLEAEYGFVLDFRDKQTLKGKADHVAVDLIRHDYPLLNELTVKEGIRMASLEDIAAMKLNAIMVSGERLKDFIDVAYLSSALSLKQMLTAYEQKYSSRNVVLILKSLAFHTDINFDEPVELFDATYEWKKVETRINQMMQTPDRLFPPLNKNPAKEQSYKQKLSAHDRRRKRGFRPG